MHGSMESEIHLENWTLILLYLARGYLFTSSMNPIVKQSGVFGSIILWSLRIQLFNMNTCTLFLFIFVSPHLLTSVVYLSKILCALVSKRNIYLAFDFGLYEWHDLFIGFYLFASCEINLSTILVRGSMYISHSQILHD